MIFYFPKISFDCRCNVKLCRKSTEAVETVDVDAQVETLSGLQGV